MPGINVVLVDVDGTLVDTNDAHARSWAEALAKGGHAVPFDKIRPLIGMGADQLLPRVSGIEAKSEEGKRLSEACLTIFREKHMPGARPFPQAAELVQRIHQKGVRIVAATSGEADIADALLERAGADAYLSGRTASDDAERSKPAPDILIAALKKFGGVPEEALLIGDSPHDVEAGRAAGVAVIALRCGGFSEESLAGAVALYDDPADLLANFDTSLLGSAG